MLPQANRAGKSESSKSEIDLLTQILKVLQGSTIAEERGQDTFSRFWAAYKKVSGEYDGDMLETCNGNMDIVLIFAGLFSAVNTAFIIAMQPNPLDTTNALLVQLIQISLYGPSAVQPASAASLSSSTGYSTNFWPQALAYASLALSLLAAFGAVLGKQWLSYYKTHCYGRGSLEDRCKQRHRKFQTLQKWQFQNVLQSFPLLLQMSLLLFGLSIAAWMRTQQHAISIFIFATTSFGFLFHVFTIVISVKSPDCPFQSPISLAIQAVLRYFRASAFPQSPVPQSPQSPVPKSPVPQSPDGDTVLAMQWILETSTNPDIISSVVELLPVIPKLPDLNIVSLCGQVQGIFKACFDHRGLAILQDSALAYGQALIHFAWKNPEAMQTLRDSRLKWNIWESWRSMYFPWALEQCLISYNRMKETNNADSRMYHQADIRTALRMAVTTGIDEFTHPDDENLVWDGQFRLHSPKSIEDGRIVDSIDQLMHCVRHFCDVNDPDVAGDALLLASGIAITLWQNPEDTQHWRDQQKHTQDVICSCIIALLNTTPGLTSSRLRRIALSAAGRILRVRDGIPDDNESLLLHAAILMTVCPPVHATEDEFHSTNAIDLSNFTEWPKDYNSELSLLPDIQHLVLRILPVPEFDDPAKYSPFCHMMIRMMGVDNLSSVRHSALHIASCDSPDLILAAAPGVDEPLRNMVLSELSPALLAIANDSSITEGALTDYLRLIAALARSPHWYHPLITDDHVGRCITLIDSVYDHDPVAGLNLTSFFLRIAPPGQEASCCGRITNKQWWSLLEAAWRLMTEAYTYGEEILNIIDIQTLVKATETYMPLDLSEIDLELLSRLLGGAIHTLRRQMSESEQTDIHAVIGLKEIVDCKLL